MSCSCNDERYRQAVATSTSGNNQIVTIVCVMCGEPVSSFGISGSGLSFKYPPNNIGDDEYSEVCEDCNEDQDDCECDEEEDECHHDNEVDKRFCAKCKSKTLRRC